MKKDWAVFSLVSCVFLVSVILEPVNGVCCRYTYSTRTLKYCGDCTTADPFCGQGRCNFFACRCEGGCREGRCSNGYGVPGLIKRESGDSGGIDTADDVIRAGDTDMNGVLSVEEAASFLQRDGGVKRSKRSLYRGLMKMDVNHDGLLTADEIDEF